MIRRTHLILILLIFIAAGCSPAVDINQPPEIVYGEDVCDACSMIISEPRFAAAYYTDSGDVRRFDDIGDMCKYHVQNSDNVARFWVHDYETETWIPAEDAVFVMSDDLYSPMASGVVAFSDSGRARTFSDEIQGKVMSFDELLDMYERGEAGHTDPAMNN